MIIEPKKYYDGIKENYLKGFSSNGMNLISINEKNFVLQHLDKLIKDRQYKKMNVLELGEGPGRFAVEVVKRDVEYIGIDISSKMVIACREVINNSKKTSILCLDISDGLPFKGDCFSFVYSIRVLQYLDDKKAMEEVFLDINRVLDKNGIFIFSIPNKISINLLNMFPNVPYMRFTRKEIIKLLEQTGFTNIKIVGGFKLPDVALNHSNNLILSIVSSIEYIFKFTNIGSRLFYIYAQKMNNINEINMNDLQPGGYDRE